MIAFISITTFGTLFQIKMYAEIISVSTINAILLLTPEKNACLALLGMVTKSFLYSWAVLRVIYLERLNVETFTRYFSSDVTELTFYTGKK